MSGAAAEWKIIYHGGGSFKGRGEYLRIMLEDKGVKYDYCGDNLTGPTGMMCAFRGSPENVLAANDNDQLFPLFFPPAIHHTPADGEPVLINQVSACMMYIGEQLGYAPKSSAERARANCILINANDYLAEGRVSFHPVKNTMSYHKQKEEGDRVSKEFSQTRMLIWLAYFESIILKNKSPQSPIAGGPDITYADFALFQVLDTTTHQFDSDHYEQAWTKANVPNVKLYHEWMKKRPNLKAYIESDRCPPYAGDSMM